MAKRRRGKPYTIEVNLLFEMKGKAHDLIDEIVVLGKSKDWVYAELKKRLKCNDGKEHMREMKTYEEVERAIICLDQMVKQVASRKPKRKQKLNARQRREDALALKRVKREVFREEMAKAAKINRIVARYPRFMQKFVRNFLNGRR